MDTITKNAKALVAAVVSFLSVVLAARFGFEIPLEWQGMIVTAVMSVVTGLLTYLIPNKQ